MNTNNNKESHRQRSVLLLISVVLAALISGCATTKPADYVMSGFDYATVENVAVLPVLDHRIDQSKQLDLDKLVLPIAERSLKGRGYPYSIERDRSLVSAISRDELETPTREFIQSLPPAHERWVFVLALDDSASKLTFGSTGNAEMSGYLFDKRNGQLVWRNKELRQIGQGGLMGMAMKGMMEKAAIEQTAMQMFQALPKRKK